MSTFLFVPNLIGYVRIILGIAAFAYAFDDYKVTVLAYSASQLLDALDGYAARALNQSSMFGAVLDMVTDRASGNILLMVLAVLHGRDKFLIFASLAALDYSSHWFCMYASVYTGASSHKTMTSSKPWLLRFYYTNKVFMFLCCVSQEVTSLSLYVIASVPIDSLAQSDILCASFAQGALLASGPLTLTKQIINVIQLVDAAQMIVNKEKSLKKK